MHPRLVQDDVRELGQAVFDVLHPAATDDLCAFSDVRLPERRLVNPIGFFHHSLAETERLEHLHRAAGDAVGLAKQQRTGFLLDDPVLMSGNAASCAASVSPAGPQPTIRTSTSLGRASGGSVPRSAASDSSGLPGLNPLRSNCMVSLASPDAMVRLLDGRELAFVAKPHFGCVGAQGATCNQLLRKPTGKPVSLRRRLLKRQARRLCVACSFQKFHARFDCCSTVRTAVSPSSLVR